MIVDLDVVFVDFCTSVKYLLIFIELFLGAGALKNSTLSVKFFHSGNILFMKVCFVSKMFLRSHHFLLTNFSYVVLGDAKYEVNLAFFDFE